jgi:8-oxo-dGTP diphosphatase
MTKKRSISLAIRDDARPGAVLIVHRPDDDDDLPGVWGLPAASLAPGEDWHDTALRAGREKLGVSLRIGSMLRHGALKRAEYTLEMKLFEAAIVAGIPSVPQDAAGVTQYRSWRWGRAEDLREAAEKGSLCSRLFLGEA